MWINKLKIAIIQKDIELLGRLLDDIPEFSNKKEMQEVSYLLKEAIKVVSVLKSETSASMKQVKKNVDFLRSVDTKVANKLDIKS